MYVARARRGNAWFAIQTTHNLAEGAATTWLAGWRGSARSWPASAWPSCWPGATSITTRCVGC